MLIRLLKVYKKSCQGICHNIVFSGFRKLLLSVMDSFLQATKERNVTKRARKVPGERIVNFNVIVIMKHIAIHSMAYVLVYLVGKENRVRHLVIMDFLDQHASINASAKMEHFVIGEY